MIVVGYIGYISEKQEEKPYVMELIKISKRIYDISNEYRYLHHLLIWNIIYYRNYHIGLFYMYVFSALR